MKQKEKGRIVIPAGRIPWAHELRVAELLAAAGYDIQFLSESTIKSADILLNGTAFEIKSPLTNKMDKIERNIKRGLKQSNNIIIDSYRMKNISDDALLRFLVKKAKQQKQINRLILITRRGKIIDINSLI